MSDTVTSVEKHGTQDLADQADVGVVASQRWRRAFRIAVGYRGEGSAHPALPASTQSQFDFVERLDSGPDYEYGVLVTNETLPIVARLIALFYNWWNVFTRLAQPDRHLEAITSRPLLLQAVGRLVTTGRRRWSNGYAQRCSSPSCTAMLAHAFFLWQSTLRWKDRTWAGACSLVYRNRRP